MSRLADSNTEFDTYQKMRSSNPVRYGEYLCELCESGLSQKEIAEMLNSNRQLIGRYQRIGRWDKEVKIFLEENRQYISNTAILTAAMSPLSKEGLLERFKSNIPTGAKSVVTPEENMGEVRNFPTLPAFSEISERLSTLEQRVAVDEDEGMAFGGYTVRRPCDIGWRDILDQLFRPESLFLLICIIGITSYLIHQGLIFFNVVDSDPVSALSSALISEVIPLLSAACLALCSKRLSRMIAAVILVITIGGLGLFMYTAIKEDMSKNSGGFTRLSDERKITLSTIGSLQESLSSLPASYVTKRQSVVEKIDKEQSKLSQFDKDIGKMEVQKQDIDSIALAYNVWLRVAAMLLNAFLVHLFFSGFRVSPIFKENVPEMKDLLGKRLHA